MRIVNLMLVCVWGVVGVCRGQDNGSVRTAALQQHDRAPHGPVVSDSIRSFVIRENDTVAYTLKLAYDQSGTPQYFFRNVYTPVCYTNECKPVFINFYWDLLGNYIRYDLPSGEVLTKADHEAFEEDDYDQLQEILANPHSLLKDFAMEELVDSSQHRLSDSVDAVTGATLKTVKAEVIEGAVYTCYTLWHIVYGEVRNKMGEITASYADNKLLHRFLESKNHHYQYWAMERVMDTEGNPSEQFHPAILRMIRGDNIFSARYALQHLSPAFFYPDKMQDWLWETYGSASYPLQIAILDRLESHPLSKNLQEQLSKQLSASNEEQFERILGLLEAQPTLHEPALQALVAGLKSHDRERTREIYRVLQAFGPGNKEMRRTLKQIK
ncbi:hypothetical protein [Parapedobacter tibetensis]|uniref:hypothetical protein n=1 Tax=Parapedobacter tibetensis TaxID=2972951 RepID=UPI00214D2175|nr:hypothetical protein [Parapedobacter tibetensis]